jgi:D-glycero-alpha-D-manno-heptose-7-phosphate kinase
MIIRSKAPLRLGLAGGGTDVSPYSDLYGGAILNATINLYAYTTIIPNNNNKISINLVNSSRILTFDSLERLPVDNEASIPAGVYNRVVQLSGQGPLSFDMTIYVDAPPGSGLGTSSTLLVSVLGAFSEWLNLPLGEYDMAKLAWEIERIDLGMAGGKQDQYAATFGGFNYMEFGTDNSVVVNPLRVKQTYMDEIAHNLLLYYTGTSRLSSKIIKSQIRSVTKNANHQIEAMHRLKDQARLMKEAILKGEFSKIGELLAYGWQFKKEMATGITNNNIDRLYESAIASGATGGKISGAGGGGYMVFYCPADIKYKVAEAISHFKGSIEPFEFTDKGLTTWTIPD